MKDLACDLAEIQLECVQHGICIFCASMACGISEIDIALYVIHDIHLRC